MKSTSVETITSNEQYVRMRIFDGDLQITDANAELIRLAQEQLASECRRHQQTKIELYKAQARLVELEKK